MAGGGYAEYICVSEKLCLPIPIGLNMIEAASLPEAIFTVWFNLFQQAKLTKGEKLLIHGGTSGVGVMGLQIANSLGIITYATAGSSEKIEFLQNLKVHHAVNYKEEDFYTVLANEKIDVILDMVGGEYTDKNLKLLNKKGRLVHINAMQTREVTINLWDVISKNLILTGSLLKPQNNIVKAALAEEIQQKVWPLLASRKVVPVVYQTFSLEHAADAHRLMESSKHIGKIILTVGE